MRICMGYWTGSMEYTSTDETHVFVCCMVSANPARYPPLMYSLVPSRRTGRLLKHQPILHTGSFVVVRFVYHVY